MVLSAINSFPFLEEERRKEFFSIAQEWVCEPKGVRTMILQPVIHALKWIDWHTVGLAFMVPECKEALRQLNHSFVWLDFPGQANRIYEAAARISTGVEQKALWDVSAGVNEVAIESAFTLNLFADTAKILHLDNVIHLTAPQLALLGWVGCLGSLALATHSLVGAKRQFVKFINAEIGSPKFNLALMRLVAKVLLATLAICGVGFFLFSNPVTEVLLLLISTAYLMLTITSHFYHKVHCKKRKKTIESQG